VSSDDPAADPRFAEIVGRLSGAYMTIGEMVVTVIREALNNGTFAPGDWLRQESLAAAIGVSRIPVRTALMQLESEGLITMYPHRGARVRSLSPQQIDEIYRMRVLLETYALRQSMARMTPQRLGRLTDLAAVLEAERHGKGFLDTRVAFYRELYDAHNNPMLVRMIDDLRALVGRFLLSIRIVSADHGHHSTLVEHIAADDHDAAVTWLTAHLEGVSAGIRAIVEDNTPAAQDGPSAPDEDRRLPGDHRRLAALSRDSGGARTKKRRQQQPESEPRETRIPGAART